MLSKIFVNLILFYSFAVAVYIMRDECPPNEEYLLCGPACPANCTTFDQQGGNSDCAGADVCAEGCFCVSGMVRGENGTCVRPEQCANPPTCGTNEELLTCGSPCEPTCDDPEPDICVQSCKIGCFCKIGFIRNSTGACIASETCPRNRCLFKEEIYQLCLAECGPMCTIPDQACRDECFADCHCQPGLKVKFENETCVIPDNCDKITEADMLSDYIKAIAKIFDNNVNVLRLTNE